MDKSTATMAAQIAAVASALASATSGRSMMRVGIAADHGGFTLKGEVAASLRGSEYDVVDFRHTKTDPRR